MDMYLRETHLLDYKHPKIQKLIAERKWAEKEPLERIKQVYHFVKDEILFGYNAKDELKASEVLADGFGQCNTKSNLLMALLRAVDIPARVHGFMIDKGMQKGALVGITYLLAPKKVIHTWVEVYYDGQWVALEGVILDERYYNEVIDKLEWRKNGYFGYAIAVKDKCSANMCFNGQNTYSQSLAITDDLGIFDSPEEFYQKYNNIPSPIKQFIYGKILSKRMNTRLQRLRKMKP